MKYSNSAPLYSGQHLKIKLVHIVYSLEIGGMENGVVNLLNHIDKKIFKPIIITLANKGSFALRINTDSIQLIELDKKEGNDLKLPFHLYRILKKFKPHIVHTHNWGSLCEGTIGAKLAKVPIIVHGEHGTIQKSRSNILIERFFLRIVDQVLSVSEMHRNKMNKIIGFPQKKIKVMLNGVDTERFSPIKKNLLIRAALGIRKDEIVIGTVGRLVKVKNQAMLILSFSRLSKNCSNIKLLLIGDGPLKENLLILAASLGIASNVLFLGKKENIPDILQAMDIFALPSISEGLSNTILEAMSCELPIVATDVGGNSEIVKNGITGYLVPSNDIEAMTKALSDLISKPDQRKQMGIASRKITMSCFSLKEMVENYEKLYLSLIAKKLKIYIRNER